MIKYRIICSALFLLTVFIAIQSFAKGQSSALKRLSESYELVQAGQYSAAKSKCDEARKLDPALAIAYLVRGEFAFQDRDYSFAVKMFDKGFPMLKNDPAQPTTVSGIPATRDQILGDVCPLYGYSLIEIAQVYAGKNERKELELLNKAKRILKSCHTYKPALHRLEMANQLLKGFP